MKKVLAINNDTHILENVDSLLTFYSPKEKYIPSQKKIRSLEIAYEKKVDANKKVV